MLRANMNSLGSTLRPMVAAPAAGSARRVGGPSRQQSTTRATKVAGPTAAVLDAIKRSPLKLELPASTPGLAAVTALVSASSSVPAAFLRWRRLGVLGGASIGGVGGMPGDELAS